MLKTSYNCAGAYVKRPVLGAYPATLRWEGQVLVRQAAKCVGGFEAVVTLAHAAVALLVNTDVAGPGEESLDGNA